MDPVSSSDIQAPHYGSLCIPYDTMALLCPTWLPPSPPTTFSISVHTAAKEWFSLVEAPQKSYAFE